MAKKKTTFLFDTEGDTGETFGKQSKKGKNDEKFTAENLPEIETDLELEGLNADIEDLTNDFASRAKKEDERLKNVGSLDFYFCVYFNDPADKWAILKALGLDGKTDGDQYLNGRDFAEALNKRLKQVLPEISAVIPPPKPFRQSKLLSMFGDDDFI